ncbi:integrase family protein [Solidesulfovibrio carbinoliphilus subsp. oakridgensis]|uniref:Integrase family protein n=1 Tax=Solidesulfovibrio carbinoliphilus subsp. oakridgensis TaxID=694327 RepID=G7QBL3_9BACT|nr:site-specific integrase [Solidesulfovibrio carbinoliphilus]EHJ48876.1 integrase family protein [Solidesulfovibrio carbinoliphilus subsp. oakridgensis]
MPAKKRFKTSYPGVYYVEGQAVATGKPERIYYVMYRRDGKLIEEKAGRQFQDAMTPAKAARIRAERIEGKAPSNNARREAEEAAKAAEVGRWTLAKLWTEYASHKPENHALSTDRSRFETYIKPAFGEKEPAEVLTLDLDRMRSRLLKQGKSPQTVKHVLALFKRLVRFGVKKGLCDSPDPRKQTISMPRVDNETTEDLDADELARLVQAIEDEPNIQAANFMRLAMFTGMRRGELFKLEWRDVDFERGFIHIRHPKGGKSQKIPLNDAARAVLASHPHVENSPYVFPGQGGKQRVTIQVASNRIKARASLPADFRPLHGLRHLFASTLASSGQVDLLTLQKLLTHKSPNMTKRYSHLRDDALKQASGVASDLLGNIGKPGDSTGCKVVSLGKER